MVIRNNVGKINRQYIMSKTKRTQDNKKILKSFENFKLRESFYYYYI